MKLTARNNIFAVIDDVLSPDLALGVRLDLEQEVYSTFNMLQHWSRIWRLGDTRPASTIARRMSEGPFEKKPYIHLLASVFDQVAKQMPELVKPYTDLRIHSHVYNRDVKIAWHVDTHSVGSFTYYAQEKWSVNWGGELFIPHGIAPVLEEVLPSFSFAKEEELLNNMIGVYISPKPNRLVLLLPGIYHMVNRVDADAGDNVRLTVVGFLLK